MASSSATPDPHPPPSRLRLAEVYRDEMQWSERPVEAAELNIGYLDPYRSAGVALELATRVAPIEYRWRLGARAPIAANL